MVNRRFPFLVLLCCLAGVSAFGQGAREATPDCATACELDQGEKPAACECDAIRTVELPAPPAGFAVVTAPQGDPPPLFPGGPPSARDFIFEAVAQYDARMADVQDYYFVEHSFVSMRGGPMMMPGFFQLSPLDGTIVGLNPIVRFFTGELGPDGEKRFKAVAPADLARMDPTAQQSGAPELTYADLATAYGELANAIPNALVSGLTEMLSAGLNEVHAGVTAQENSEDGFGGDGQSDGIGMALEDQLFDQFIQGGHDMHLGAYIETIGGHGGFQLVNTVSRRETQGPFPDGSFPSSAWNRSCIVESCDNPSFDRLQGDLRNWAQTFLEFPATFAAYVIRQDESDGTSEIEINGSIYEIESAEAWMLNLNSGSDPFGNYGGANWVPARRKMVYTQVAASGFQRMVIDTYSEDFEPTPILAPRKITQVMKMMGTNEAKVTKMLSQLTVNAGPPSQEDINALIAAALEAEYGSPTGAPPQ